MAANKPHLLPALDKDYQWLRDNLQEKDRKELNATLKFFHTYKKVFFYGLKNDYDNCYTGFYDNKIILGCGVRLRDDLPEGYGEVWLLTSKWAKTYPKAYFKLCAMAIRKGFERAPKALVLATMDEYTEAVSVNERLGFRKEHDSIIVNGKIFHRWILKKEHFKYGERI